MWRQRYGADPNVLLFAGLKYKPTLKDRRKDIGFEAYKTFALDWLRIAVDYGADVNATMKSINADKRITS